MLLKNTKFIIGILKINDDLLNINTTYFRGEIIFSIIWQEIFNFFLLMDTQNTQNIRNVH